MLFHLAVVTAHQRMKSIFQQQLKHGTLTIADSTGANVVKTVSILVTTAAGKSGIVTFEWDGKDKDGTQLADGYYAVTADYVDSTGTSKTTQFGVYPVESIRYENGASYVKLGSTYYPISDVVEYYQP